MISDIGIRSVERRCAVGNSVQIKFVRAKSVGNVVNEERGGRGRMVDRSRDEPAQRGEAEERTKPRNISGSWNSRQHSNWKPVTHTLSPTGEGRDAFTFSSTAIFCGRRRHRRVYLTSKHSSALVFFRRDAL